MGLLKYVLKYVIHVDYADGTARNYYYIKEKSALRKKQYLEEKYKRENLTYRRVTLHDYPLPKFYYQ